MDEHGNGGVVTSVHVEDNEPPERPSAFRIDVDGKIHRGCPSPAIPTLIEDDPSSITIGDVCLLLDGNEVLLVEWTPL